MQYINHIGYCGRDDSSDYLAHYGVKGMKWDPRKLKRWQDQTQEAMDRTQMAVNNARAAVADGRKSATRRWEYIPTAKGGAANVYYRRNDKSKELVNDVSNKIIQQNPLIDKKKKQKRATEVARKLKNEFAAPQDGTYRKHGQAAFNKAIGNAVTSTYNARSAISDAGKHSTRRFSYLPSENPEEDVLRTQYIKNKKKSASLKELKNKKRRR